MNKPSFTPFPEIHTDRLVLRPLKPEDAPIIFNYQRYKDNFPHVDMPVYENLQEAEAYIEKMKAGVSKDHWIIWGIADPDTDEVLGSISIWNINLETATAEFGYGLYPGNSGKGYMTEALLAASEYGLHTLGFVHLEAYTNVENAPSLALLERCGFVKTKEITEETSDGQAMTMAVYVIEA